MSLPLTRRAQKKTKIFSFPRQQKNRNASRQEHKELIIILKRTKLGFYGVSSCPIVELSIVSYIESDTISICLHVGPHLKRRYFSTNFIGSMLLRIKQYVRSALYSVLQSRRFFKGCNVLVFQVLRSANRYMQLDCGMIL